MKRLYSSLLFLLILIISNANAQTLSEDFETAPDIAAYAGNTVTLASGEWYIKGITQMDISDHYNDTRGVRFRGNSSDAADHRVEMLFDKPNGAGTITFKYGSYSSHNGGELKVYTSSNQGATWTQRGNTITVPSWTTAQNKLLTAIIPVNVDGDIRIKIVKSNTKTTTSVNIDDIEISDYGTGTNVPQLIVDKTNISFGSVVLNTNSDPQTLTMSGKNLSHTLAYSLKEDQGITDVLAFSIEKIDWNKNEGGTISITFKPEEERDYAVVLEIVSEGANTINIPITGKGVKLNSLSTLSAIKIDDVDLPGFDPNTFDYTHMLPEGYTGIPEINPIPTDAAATLVFQQPQAIPATVKIEVYAKDGLSRKIYNLTINPFVSQSSDASLSGIQVNGDAVLDFDANTTTYAYMLPQGYTGQPLVSATTNNSKASVTITQPTSTREMVSITVTAEDGTTQAYYLYLRPHYKEPVNNYISNGGFEEWNSSGRPRLWFGSKTDINVALSRDSHEGKAATELINPASDFLNLSTANTYIESGYGYEISFWVKGKGKIRTGLYDEREDNEGFAPYNTTITINSNEWQQYIQTVRTKKTINSAQFILSAANTEGLFIDDIFVYSYPVIDPSLFTDLDELDFEDVYITEESEEQTINISSEQLTEPILYAITGADATAFAVREAAGWNADTGGDLILKFAPDTDKAYSATLELHSEGAAPVMIPLKGIGAIRSAIATLSEIKVNETSIPMQADRYSYSYMLPIDDAGVVPAITPVPTDKNATLTYSQPTQLASLTTIEVLSPDRQETKEYTLRIVDHFEEPAINYIQNGGFEIWSGNTATGWEGSLTPGAAVYSQTTDSHFGFYAVELVRALPNATYFSTQRKEIKQDYFYKVSYWVKGKGKIQPGYYYEKDGNEVYDLNEKPELEINSTEWVEYTEVFQSPVDYSQAEFFFSFRDTDGLFIDDVVIETYRTLYPEMNADVTEIDFGTVYITDASEPKVVTITTVDLTDDIKYELEGEGKEAFTITESDNWSTTEGGKLSIVFTPTLNKTYSLNLLITQPAVPAITIPITGTGKTKSTDATLSKIWIDGTLFSDFNPATLEYNVIVPKSKTTVPVVTVELSEANAKKTITPATAIPGTTTIKVTAHSGAEKTYKINFKRSTDATLSALKVNGIDVPGFNANTLEYTYVLPKNDYSIPVITATVNDATNGAVATFSQPSAVPATVTIKVTAGDNATVKNYKLIINPYTEENQGDNYILNGGFEQWSNNKPKEWYGSKSDISLSQAGSAHGGSYAVALTNTGSTYKIFSTTDIHVDQKYAYEISFWAKGKGEVRTAIYDERAGGGVGPYNTPYVINTSTWRQYFQEVNATNTTDLAQLLFSIRNTNGLYIDDVFVRAYPYLEPKITSDLAEVNFNQVYINKQSAALTVKITGKDLSEAINYTITGTDKSVFTVTKGTWNPTTGGELKITMKPTEVREYNAQLELKSAGAPTLIIPLKGKGKVPSAIATLSGIKVNGTAVTGFRPDVYYHYHMLPKNNVGMPVIEVTKTDPDATATFQNPTKIPATVTIQVTSPNGAETKTYYLRIVNYYEDTVGNHIANGGFEQWNGTKPTGWVGNETNNETEYSKSEDTHAGFYSVKLVRSSATQVRFSTTAVSLKANHKYHFSYWVKGKGSIRAGYFNGGSEYKYGTYNAINSNTWTQYTETFEPGITTNQAEFLFSIGNAEGLYIDDVVIIEERIRHPAMSADTDRIDYGLVYITDSSLQKAITITAVDLEGNINYKVEGTGKEDFIIQEDNWSMTEGGVLYVSFKPTKQQNYNVNLIVSHPEVSAITIPLTGTGKAKSTDATLAKLWIDGELIPGFSPSTTEYNIIIPKAVTTVPSITVQQNDASATYTISKAPAIPGTTTINVTAQSGATKEYKVNFKRSTDATLTELKVNGIAVPGFNPNTLNYTYTLPKNDYSIPVVAATANDQTNGAVVTITQPQVVPSTVTIKVTAGDNTTVKSYKLTIQPYSEETQGENHILNGGFEDWRDGRPREWYGSKSDISLQQSTDRHGGSYAVELINTTSAYKIFSTANISVKQKYGYEISFWAKGKGEVRTGLFDQRSGDGMAPYNAPYSINTSTWRQYFQTVSATNESDLAQIIFSVRNTNGLVIDDVFVRAYPYLEPEITANVTNLDFGQEYINETSAEERISITAKDLSTAITYTITGADQSAFAVTTSNGWHVLNGGELKVAVRPVQLREYNAQLVLKSGDDATLTIPLKATGRERSADATLSSIKVNGVEIPGFSPSTMNYNYMLPESATGNPVISLTTSDPDAKASFQQPTSLPATVVIQVLSSNEKVSKTYRVRIARFFEEPENHIANGSFEKWSGGKPTGWVGDETLSDTEYSQSEEAHSGFYSVKLVRTSSTAVRFSTKAVSLKKDYRYKISYWAKGKGSVKAGYFNGSNDYEYGPEETVNSNTWKQYFTEALEPGIATSKAEFLFAVRNAEGLFIDDVVVTPIRILYPKVTATPGSLAFGTIYVTDSSESKEVTVTGVDLSQDISCHVEGTGAAAFRVVKDADWNNRTGGKLQITFVPIQQTDYNVNLIIKSEVNPISIPLTGTGKTKSSDATLSKILIDGQLIPDFSPSKTEYNYIIPKSSNRIPVVSAEKNQAQANFSITNATTIPGTTSIEVVSHSGTKNTYKVNFIRSSNANLSSLAIDGVELPGFSPDQTEYQYMLAEGYSGIPVITATAADATNGAEPAFDEPTTIPATVSIVVTAGDNVTKKNYTLRIVHYYEEPENNFIANGGFEQWNGTNPQAWKGSQNTATYSQSADAYAGFYAVELSNTSSDAKHFTTQPYAVTFDYGYTISFYAKGIANIRAGVYDGTSNNLSETIAVNTSTWKLYKQDVFPGQTTAIGEFLFAVSNTNGFLIDNVVISQYRILHPAVSADVASFSFEETYKWDASDPQTVTVTAVDLSQPLSYAVIGEDVNAFSITEENWDSLNGGTLSIRFTPDEVKEYQANITISSPEKGDIVIPATGTAIARRTSSILTNLMVDGTPVENFDPSTLNYQMLIYKSRGGMPVVTATTEDEGATVEVLYPSEIPGKTEIVVTAHDKETTTTYSIDFYRSSDASLASITVNGLAIPDFNPETYSYSYMLPVPAQGAPEVIATPTIDNAQVLYTVPETLPATISIRVIAEDDRTERVYILRLVNNFQEPIGNYASNGGFEVWSGTDPVNWLGSQSQILKENYSRTDDAYEGFYAIRLTNLLDTDKLLSTYPCTVIAGLDYEISFYAKGNGSIRTGLYTKEDALPADNESLLFNNAYVTVESNTTWTQYSQAITAPADSRSAEFILAFKATGVTVDNVVIRVKHDSPALFSNTEALSFGQVYVKDTASRLLLAAGANLQTGISYELAGTGIETLTIDNSQWSASTGGCLSLTYTPVGNEILDAQLILKSGDTMIKTIPITGEGLVKHSNANIVSLSIDGNPFPGFNPEITEYNYMVPLSHSGIPVIAAEKEDELASITIDQATAIPGSATITITAHDEVTVKTYSIHFSRCTDATLADLQVDGKSITGFHPNIRLYYVTLEEGYTGLPTVSATTNDQEYGAKVDIVQATRLPEKVVVSVHAADGENVIIYTINFSNYNKEYKGNYLLNDSFEFWTENEEGDLLPDDWFGSKTSIGLDGVARSATPNFGYYACELINTLAAHKRFSTQTRSVVAGRVYEITFYVKGNGEIRTALFDDREADSGFSGYNEFITINSSEWTKYTQYVKAENTTGMAEFIFSVRNTAGLYIDDVLVRDYTDVGMDNVYAMNAYAYVSEGRIIVENVPHNAVVTLYDITGLAIETIRSADSRVTFTSQGKEVNLISITAKEGSRTLKLINHR